MNWLVYVGHTWISNLVRLVSNVIDSWLVSTKRTKKVIVVNTVLHDSRGWWGRQGRGMNKLVSSRGIVYREQTIWFLVMYILLRRSTGWACILEEPSCGFKMQNLRHRENKQRNDRVGWKQINGARGGRGTNRKRKSGNKRERRDETKRTLKKKWI